MTIVLPEIVVTWITANWLVLVGGTVVILYCLAAEMRARNLPKYKIDVGRWYSGWDYAVYRRRRFGLGWSVVYTTNNMENAFNHIQEAQRLPYYYFGHQVGEKQ